jgi:phosphoribosyl 1,2-cyclic phosphate phosphodiesterase
MIKSLGYLFNKTAYISDCNDLSIVNLNILKNLNYLILDCLKIDKHPTHFNLDQALYVSNQLKPKKTILTNLHYDLDYDFLISKLPKNVLPAYDGLKINL